MTAWFRVPLVVRTWRPGLVDAARLRRDIDAIVSNPALAGVGIELRAGSAHPPTPSAEWVDLLRHAGNVSVVAAPSVVAEWRAFLAAAEALT